LKNDLVIKNSELAATLVHRSSRFTARHPPRLVASASILLALRECQSRLVEGVAEGAWQISAESNSVDSLSRDLQRWLSLEIAGFESRHGDCLDEMETLLLKDLPKSPAEKSPEVVPVSSPVKFGTPPGASSSPFKISSASTPKRSRLPLRDGSNLPLSSYRRRLQQQVAIKLFCISYITLSDIRVLKNSLAIVKMFLL